VAFATCWKSTHPDARDVRSDVVEPAAGGAPPPVEVRERIAADGAVVEIAGQRRGRRARHLVAAGIEAIAICFINSYRNPRTRSVPKRSFDKPSPTFSSARRTRCCPR